MAELNSSIDTVFVGVPRPSWIEAAQELRRQRRSLCVVGSLPAAVLTTFLAEVNASSVIDGDCGVLPPCSSTSRLNESGLFVRTSGSTGDSLLVNMAWEAVDFVCSSIQSRLGYVKGDRIGVYVPLSFDYGLYQAFLAADARARVLLFSQVEAGPFLLRTLAESRITVLPAVPSLIRNLLALLRARKGVELPYLRMITSTGEHLPGAWIDELRERLPGVRIYSMYGLTECKRVSILLPDELERKPGSVGRPLDDTEVFTVDADGNAILDGACGELVVLGPHVANGYRNAPMASGQRFRSFRGRRALYTGDWGRIDRDGYIYVDGRRDSLFKFRGLRISRIEVENCARTVGDVDDAALLINGDEMVLVVASCRPSVSERVLGHLVLALEPYKVPHRIVVTPEFPRNPNGKLDRSVLAATVGLASS